MKYLKLILCLAFLICLCSCSQSNSATDFWLDTIENTSYDDGDKHFIYSY